MIIAMVTVRVVQVAIDEVVDMVSVWNCFVTAIRSVNVARIMSAASVGGGA